MNGIALVNRALTLEVNFAPGLFVGLTVYDDSGVTPTQVGSVISMLNVVDTLYRAKFTPSVEGTYLFRKAVYTDGTFTVLDPDYARSSESVQVGSFSGSSNVGEAVLFADEEDVGILEGDCG